MNGQSGSIPADLAAADIDRFKHFHQYYRDVLSTHLLFPDIGKLPTELIDWVTDRRNTDVVGLAEHLATMPGSGLAPEQDLALRLMLFAIVHANLASDFSNRYPDSTLPANVAADIKRGLGRVLELHPANEYVVNCVLLLYRIKEVEEVLFLAESYPDIFAQFPVLQAVVGFILSALGRYETGMEWLAPLAAHPEHRNLPLVGLAFMTCQHFLGKTPEWPLDWASLHQEADELEVLLDTLAPLRMIEPLRETPRPVVFVACDTRYFFEHALSLIYSVYDANRDKLDLHLHLYSPEPTVFNKLDEIRKGLPGLKIGISAEYPAASVKQGPAYYASVRFARAYQVMMRYRCALCLIDADAIFNKDWDTFESALAPQTELVLARTHASPFWERILGGFLYCRPTPLSERFLAKVALFILRNLELGKSIWFMDQIALSACDDTFTAADPAVLHIDWRSVIDLEHKPDTLCWMVSTIKNGNKRYDEARERLAKRHGVS